MTEKSVYYDQALIAGRTESGKDWLRTYVHPPSTKPGTAYNGYPDRSTVPTVQSFYKLVKEAAPYAISGQTTNIVILRSPGLLLPVYAATNIPNDPASENIWVGLVGNTQIQQVDVVRNFGKLRLNAYSVTEELDATAFNNSGMVRTAQFSPSTYVVDVAQLTELLENQGREKDFKNIERIHGHFGDKYGDEFREWVEHRGLAKKKGIAPRAINANWRSFQVVRLGKPITQPDDITMLSPKSTTRRAVEGNFVVHQVTEDINTWQDLQPNRGASGTADDFLVTCYEQTFYVGTTVTSYIEPFGGLNDQLQEEVPWGDWSWSISFYENINSSNGGAKIDFKVVQHWEYTPLPGGFTNQFARQPALYDPDAINNGTIIMQARDDSLPAKYNSMGMMASIASAVAPALIKDVVSSALPLGGKKAAAAENALCSRKEANEKADGENTLATASQMPNIGILRNMPYTGRLNTRFSAPARRPAPRRARSQSRGRSSKGVAKLTRMVSKLQVRRGRSSSRGRSQSNSRKRVGFRTRSKSRR